MTTPICFVDTETTGVHPGRRPWEVAIIRREPGADGHVHDRELVFQVYDVDLSNAESASEDHGNSRACGVEPPGDDERHTALGDARWAMRLYDAITGGES